MNIADLRPWTKQLPERRIWGQAALLVIGGVLALSSIDDVLAAADTSTLALLCATAGLLFFLGLATVSTFLSGLVTWRRRRYSVDGTSIMIGATPITGLAITFSGTLISCGTWYLTSLWLSPDEVIIAGMPAWFRSVGGVVAVCGGCAMLLVRPGRRRLVIGREQLEIRGPFTRFVVPWVDITRLTAHAVPERPASTDDWTRSKYGLRLELTPETDAVFKPIDHTRSGAPVAALSLAGLDYDPNTLANAIRALYEQPKLRDRIPDIAPIMLAGPTDGELRRMVIGDTWLRPHERAQQHEAPVQ